MVKIKLFRRDDNLAEDVRVPYVLTTSRVPCVGEMIVDMQHKPGSYRVLHVKHFTNLKSQGAIAAEVDVEYVNM